jgi:hypothetical protein
LEGYVEAEYRKSALTKEQTERLLGRKVENVYREPNQQSDQRGQDQAEQETLLRRTKNKDHT